MEEQILDDFEEKKDIPYFRKSAYGFVLGAILFLLSFCLIVFSPLDNGLITNTNDYYANTGGVISFCAFIINLRNVFYILKSFYSKEDYSILLRIILFTANAFLCVLSGILSFLYLESLSDMY